MYLYLYVVVCSIQGKLQRRDKNHDSSLLRWGRITRDRHALRVEIDGRNGPGDLVIGAAAVRELFDGKEVDVSFVQVRSTDQVFIGWSGDGPGLPQRPGDHPPD